MRNRIDYTALHTGQVSSIRACSLGGQHLGLVAVESGKARMINTGELYKDVAEVLAFCTSARNREFWTAIGRYCEFLVVEGNVMEGK